MFHSFLSAYQRFTCCFDKFLTMSRKRLWLWAAEPDELTKLTASRPEYETLWSLGAGLTMDWRRATKEVATANPNEVGPACAKVGLWSSSPPRFFLAWLLFALTAAQPLAAREKEKVSYGEGLIINVPLPESEVEQVVQEVVQNGIIRGTKEYNKDEFVSGAKPATSSRVFPQWNEAGKVFYKVREQALDPRNFKDSSDSGTLVVRYVVQAQGEKNTVLRIDALFKEDYRHTVHSSNGSVESAEYKDIQEHLEAIEVMKQQNVEAEQERKEQLAKKNQAAVQTYAPMDTAPEPEPHPSPSGPQTQQDRASQASAAPSQGQVSPNQTAPSPAPLTSTPPGQTLPAQALPGQPLEEHVKDLRKLVERLVKAPGAPLKSAPFHTATTLQTLTTGTEVLILISTPYWYGIETHEGQHGWMMRDQLEEP